VSAVPEHIRERAVSVVVSTYNRQEDLREALDALLHQTGDVPYEVLIVDNNSTDRTRRVVESAMPGSHVPLRYLFEPQQGVSYGRNTGIRNAQAPIIAFTDDDCRPAPDWIASIVRAFDRFPEVDCVGGRVVPTWPAEVPSWFSERQTSPLAICEHGDRAFPVDANHAATCLLTANLACRRTAFEKAGLFSTEFPRGQDREIQLRMWRNGCRGMYVPDVVVTVPVPADRLKKPYFRRWYAKYGVVHARLELRETLDRDGRLRTPSAGSRLFGTAPHLYRAFASAAMGWLGATLRFCEADRFYYENQLRYLWNYLVTSYRRDRTAAHTSIVGQLARFARARLRRRFSSSVQHGNPTHRAGSRVRAPRPSGAGSEELGGSAFHPSLLNEGEERREGDRE
jgi:glycosyltransferase involved in cell wall biosynthesis